MNRTKEEIAYFFTGLCFVIFIATGNYLQLFTKMFFLGMIIMGIGISGIMGLIMILGEELKKAKANKGDVVEDE